MEKLMNGGDSAEGTNEADEATKAIDALNVKSTTETTDEPVKKEEETA